MDVDADRVIIPEPIFSFDLGTPLAETGDDIPTVDIDPEQIVPPAKRGPKSRRAEPETGEREPKSGPPALDEWMDFFSRIVLNVICDYYISWAFSGVDEDVLSEREVERLALSSDERTRIARPFAELSYKSKFMRKHGRTIVASGGAVDAVIALGAWASRVNRIAKKYKPQRSRANGRSGQGTANGTEPQANGFDYEGANGGRIADGFTIFNPGG